MVISINSLVIDQNLAVYGIAIDLCAITHTSMKVSSTNLRESTQ